MAKKERVEGRVARLKDKKQTPRRARRIQKLEDKASGDYTRKEIRQRKTGRKVEATKAEIDRIGEGGRKRRLTDRLGIQSDRLERLTPKTKTPTKEGGPAGDPKGKLENKVTKVDTVTGVQPNVSKTGKKPGSYVKPGGKATGKMSDYALNSQARRDEYTRRGWAQDETTKVTPTKSI